MEDRIAGLLRDGQAAARAGQRSRARRKFRTVLVSDPANVTALLWMAWLGDDPRASLAYIVRALSHDPHNPQAHAALRWARQRMQAPVPTDAAGSPAGRRRPAHRRWERPVIALGLILLLATCGIVGGLLTGSLLQDLPVFAALAASPSPAPTVRPVAAVDDVASPASTRTPVSTLTPTATRTETPTLPPLPTRTPTLVSTPNSLTPPPMPTPLPLPPTNTPVLPRADSGIRWIDVDLTNQRLTAYEGQTIVRSTLVSTGLSRTPTPVGMFRIYIKLRYDDMSGPDYYLRNVPYTMYFHRGYGLHGTYWHSNFGRPMSHGCVNLPTAEAEWLFSWAEIGTLVNVHY